MENNNYGYYRNNNVMKKKLPNSIIVVSIIQICLSSFNVISGLLVFFRFNYVYHIYNRMGLGHILPDKINYVFSSLASIIVVIGAALILTKVKKVGAIIYFLGEIIGIISMFIFVGLSAIVSVLFVIILPIIMIVFLCTTGYLRE